MSSLKSDITRLKLEGKTAKEISQELDCHIDSVYYHTNGTSKKNGQNRTRRYLKTHAGILMKKVAEFKRPSRKKRKSFVTPKKLFMDKVYHFRGVKGKENMKYTYKDVLKKIGNDIEISPSGRFASGKRPVCYLTGRKIDLNDSKSYSLDHKNPSSKGGSNKLENLGVCSSEANIVKSDLTIEELLDICKDIVSHNLTTSELKDWVNDLDEHDSV